MDDKTSGKASSAMTISLLATLYLFSLLFVQVRTIGHVPAVIISFIGVMYLLLWRQPLGFDTHTFIPIVLLAITGFVSVVLNFNKTSLVYLLGIVINAMLYNNLINRISKRHLKIFFGLLVLASVIPLYDANKFASIFGNSITLGMVLNVSIALLFLLWDSKKIRLVFSFVFLWLIYLTGSRSALLFVFVFFFLYWIYSWKGKKAFLLASVFVVGLTLFLYFYLSINDNYRHIIMKYHQRNIFDLSGRNTLFNISMKGVREHPFGLGLGKSDDYIRKFSSDSSPHNAFLKIALEGGWLFLAAYLFLLIMAIRHSRLKVTACALVAYNLKSFFEIGTPFGYSFVSAFLILPYFLEKAFPVNHEGPL